MIKGLRVAKIKEILINVGSVKVDELSQLMDVSLVTIRNDLRELEKEGFATRIHGGAIINADKRVGEFDPRLRQGIGDVVTKDILIPLSAEKRIAYIAQNMIADNSWIFLGCGSTCASIAHALIDKRINVLTNSILVASMFAESPMVNVIVAGGVLAGSYRSYTYGDLFVKSIQNMRVDMAFFGTSAINFEQGFSVRGQEEGSIFRAVRKISRQMIIVAGAYKYGKDSYFTLANLDEPDMVIVEKDIPSDFKGYFDDHGVKVVTQVESEGLLKYEEINQVV